MCFNSPLIAIDPTDSRAIVVQHWCLLQDEFLTTCYLSPAQNPCLHAFKLSVCQGNQHIAVSSAFEADSGPEGPARSLLQAFSQPCAVSLTLSAAVLWPYSPGCFVQQLREGISTLRSAEFCRR